MNATQVLKKIMTTLSLAKEEVLFAYAKLADGTILESPTFDVGEKVEVVAEDGKSPAPAGEHELILRDSEGKEERIKIMVDAEGKITERENVELEEKEEKMESEAGGDMGDDEEVSTEETAEPIDEDMKKHNDMKKVMEDMTYRIEELEKKMQDMQEVKEEDKEKMTEEVKTQPLPGDPGYKADEKMAAVEPDEEDEDELPKLDGAPIDENAQKPNIKLGKNGIVANPQNTFLSKLYK
jgi:AAA15 family ATPase/GTPase